jgi:predicted ribosomally synthesized peptide with nif11-like leader
MSSYFSCANLLVQIVIKDKKMSKENLEKFMQQVQLDPSLQQKLAAAPDKEQASRLAVELGAELGLEFTLAEVLDLDYSGELDESELDAVAGGGLSRY